MRLDGKVALITGAAGGMGRVAAELFAAEGARVVVADVDRGRGRGRTVDAIRGRGRRGRVRARRRRRRRRRSQAMVDVRGRHASAGCTSSTTTPASSPPTTAASLDTPEATWDRVMAVNLKGVWLGCRHGIPAMLESGGGSIDQRGVVRRAHGRGRPRRSRTPRARAACSSMTREIAVEYARQGIRANALCPGPDPDAAARGAAVRSRQRAPAGWCTSRWAASGRPRSSRKAALFLASDDSSFMTGAALVVDGGITAAYVTPE